MLSAKHLGAVAGSAGRRSIDEAEYVLGCIPRCSFQGTAKVGKTRESFWSAVPPLRSATALQNDFRLLSETRAIPRDGPYVLGCMSEFQQEAGSKGDSRIGAFPRRGSHMNSRGRSPRTSNGISSIILSTPKGSQQGRCDRSSTPVRGRAVHFATLFRGFCRLRPRLFMWLPLRESRLSFVRVFLLGFRSAPYVLFGAFSPLRRPRRRW